MEENCKSGTLFLNSVLCAAVNFTSGGAASIPSSCKNATGLTASFTVSSSPTPGPTNTPPQGPSTGSIPGIVIGALIGGLIIVALTGWSIWRRLRGVKEGDSHPSMAELGTGRPKPSELGSDLNRDEIAELESRRRAAELQGRRKLPAELLGNPRAELEARRVEGRIMYEMGTS